MDQKSYPQCRNISMNCAYLGFRLSWQPLIVDGRLRNNSIKTKLFWFKCINGFDVKGIKLWNISPRRCDSYNYSHSLDWLAKSSIMSNIRGRFPGRPLSARRQKARLRLTESDFNRSLGSSAFETAQHIQRGLEAFHHTFNLPTSHLLKAPECIIKVSHSNCVVNQFWRDFICRLEYL